RQYSGQERGDRPPDVRETERQVGACRRSASTRHEITPLGMSLPNTTSGLNSVRTRNVKKTRVALFAFLPLAWTWSSRAGWHRYAGDEHHSFEILGLGDRGGFDCAPLITM